MGPNLLLHLTSLPRPQGAHRHHPQWAAREGLTQGDSALLGCQAHALT